MKSAHLPAAVAEAVDWLALHRSGTMSTADRQRFEHWLHANPEHARVWQQLQERVGQLFSATPAHARDMLERAGNSRRRLLRGALGIAGVGVAGGWLQRQGLLPAMGSDLQTRVAQRQYFELADGSRVLLNACSQVDLRFDAQQRVLLLREGALNVEVARDAARPLIVRTAFGEARALGTRFSVTLLAGAARVQVQRSRVLASVPGSPALELAAGQGALLDGQRAWLMEAQQAQASSWEDGRLEIHDRPLREVIEALRPYRHGWLYISDEAAALRVSGVFPLDDSEQTLRILQEVLPVQVEQPFPWWTRLSLHRI